MASLLLKPKWHKRTLVPNQVLFKMSVGWIPFFLLAQARTIPWSVAVLAQRSGSVNTNKTSVCMPLEVKMQRKPRKLSGTHTDTARFKKSRQTHVAAQQITTNSYRRSKKSRQTQILLKKQDQTNKLAQKSIISLSQIISYYMISYNMISYHILSTKIPYNPLLV